MRTGKFGLSKTRQYKILSGMKQRCYNPNSPHYGQYGARGITICDEWLGADGAFNFFTWSLSHGYSESLTIDRIDNDAGYSPDNCIWIEPYMNSMHSSLEDKLLRIISACPTFEDDFLQMQISKVKDSEYRTLLKARFNEIRKR